CTTRPAPSSTTSSIPRTRSWSNRPRSSWTTASPQDAGWRCTPPSGARTGVGSPVCPTRPWAGRRRWPSSRSSTWPRTAPRARSGPSPTARASAPSSGGPCDRPRSDSLLPALRYPPLMTELRAASAVGASRQRGEETRERVLVAASRLLATQGFDATSVEAVADAAGITVPGMYRHYPTKHELLLAVARRATATSAARRALAEGTPLATGLAELFGEYLADGQIERRRLSIEISRAAFGDEELHRALVADNERLRAALTQTILSGEAGVDEAEA